MTRAELQRLANLTDAPPTVTEWLAALICQLRLRWQIWRLK